MSRITLAAVGAAAVGAAALAPGSASAAEINSFGCSANALQLTVLGQKIEPAVAKAGAINCVNENNSLLTLPDSIPLLGAGVAPAATVSANAGGEKQSAAATGGLANVRVKPLSVLAPVQNLLNQLVQGVPPLTVPLVGTIDIRPALVNTLSQQLDLLPDLLSVGAATSDAKAGYDADGNAKLEGVSKIADVKLLGQEVAINGTLERVVNLLDTANLDLGSLLPLDQILVTRSAPERNVALKTAVSGLPAHRVQPDEELRVRDAIKQAQAAPKQALAQAGMRARAMQPRAALIPPALAHVKLAANQQQRTANTLTQQALTAKISLLNQPLLDAVIGQATVSGSDRKQEEPPELACTKRRLVLNNVVTRGRRVRLEGVSASKFIGKKVSIFFAGNGKRVGRARVRKDNTFATRTKLPARAVRHTNKARYQARIGREKSMNLKLNRRMIVSRTRSGNGKVQFRGRVVKPLAATPRRIVVKERKSCKKWKRVGTIRPNRRTGRFKLTVKAPAKSEGRAIYRLQTRVRNNTRNPKTFPTFTLPLGVNIKN